MGSSGHKESFLDRLQNKWAESTTTQKRKIRKVNIPAGKSITAEDVLGENQREGPQPSTSRGPSAKNKFSRRVNRRNKKGCQSSSEIESLIYCVPEIGSYEDAFL
jgi:hypothetical protein